MPKRSIFVSIYQRLFLPRLIDLAMRSTAVLPYRSRIVPLARGTVAEIGIGSGLNLPYYGSGVERLYGIDPSEALLRMAEQRVRDVRFPVELLPHPGEALPLPDASVDTVVTTFTLCSVEDPAQALREMKRVLKPGGTLLFAEHGLAPEPAVACWQRRLNPLWKRASGGCNIDRKMDALIARAGFSFADLATGYARGPRLLTWIYSGQASLAA